MTVIVVSGPPGSGTSTVGKKVSEKLDLDYFSPGKYVKEEIEGNESESASKAWKERGMDEEEKNKSIDDLQKQVASQGDVVVEGRLSIYMLEEFYDLSVWLRASLKTRAERTAKRDGISVEEAKEHLKERQHNEVEAWKDIYGFNYLEQRKEADLVIDSEKFSAEEIADKIVSKFQ